MGAKHFFYILVCLVIVSCKNSSLKEGESDAKIVAKAGNDKLDINEFTEEFVSTGIIKDSIYNKYLSFHHYKSN